MKGEKSSVVAQIISYPANNGTHEFLNKSQLQMRISNFVTGIPKIPKNDVAMV